MSTLGMLSGRSRRDSESGVIHLRLPDPLAASLTAFDFHNRRIKVFEVDAGAFVNSEVAGDLIREMDEGGQFSKLTVYARERAAADGGPTTGGADDARHLWSNAGFAQEGTLAGFFADDADAALWTRYSDPERASEAGHATHEQVLELALSKRRDPHDTAPIALPDGHATRVAHAGDSEQIAGLMQTVFEEYPSDLSAEHIARQIATHRSVFRVVTGADDGLVAVASAEIDFRRHTAEITDCVTAVGARGSGLSTGLVQALHADLGVRYKVTTTYSLARAGEPGINCVLARLGYEYGGRLVNNCRMPEGWESMNVWCRSLRPAPGA